MEVPSDYELQRHATIAQNHARLQELGLEPLAPRPHLKRSPSTSKAKPTNAEPTRASKRLKAPMKKGGSDRQDGPEGGNEGDAVVSPPPAPMYDADEQRDQRRPRQRIPRAPSAVIDGVRAYVEEHVPDGWAIEEREMFGMAMWLVRGNMFLGIGLTSERLLVRVGEPQVEPTLAAHPNGVSRCGSGERTFPGTLMVELEQFCGDERMTVWFELAMAHNTTLESKAPGEKPRKRAKLTGKLAARGVGRVAPQERGSAAKAEEEEVLEVSEEEEEAEAEGGEGDARGRGGGGQGAGGRQRERRGGPSHQFSRTALAPTAPVMAATTASASASALATVTATATASVGPSLGAQTAQPQWQFAQRVLHVIERIPAGKVAGYGQVAGLAGAPRNARQVGFAPCPPVAAASPSLPHTLDGPPPHQPGIPRQRILQV